MTQPPNDGSGRPPDLSDPLEFVVPEDTPHEQSSAPRQGAGRSTAIFALWTGLSRVIGLARETAASALYGVGGAINAFVFAFQIPNLIRSLVADSAISAAFVPTFTELDEQGKRGEAARLAGAFVGIITLALGVITLIAILLAPTIMPLITPDKIAGPYQDDVVRLTQLMFPIVLLLGLTGLVMGILQAHHEFAATAFVPVLWNAVIIGVMVGATPFVADGAKIYMYAIGVVAGTTAQLLWLLPGLRGKGPFPLSLGRGNPHVGRVLRLMGPVTLGLGLINFTLFANIWFAGQISEESPRALDAAFRLYILPQGMFSVAVSTVLFPLISRFAARGDRAGMRDAIKDGTRQIFFLLMPSAVLLGVLAEPAIRLVNEHGAWEAIGTTLGGEALLYFAIGLLFNGGSLLMIRSFFSLKMPWIPTKVSAVTLLLNLVLDALLYKPMGVGGIALATSISSAAGFFVLTWLLRRELGGLDLRSLVDGFTKTLVASLWLGTLAWATWRLLDDALGRSLVAQLISMGAALTAGGIAYLTAAKGLAIPEIRVLARVARSLRPN